MKDTFSLRSLRNRLLVSFAILAGILLGLHSYLSDEGQAENLLQVSGALLNLVLISILGGAASYAYRRMENEKEKSAKLVDLERERQRALRAFRQEFLREFIRACHVVKSCRRMLSRSGLTVRAPQERGYTDSQLSTLVTEMFALNDAQLQFEWLVAEVRSSRSSFSDAEPLIEHLTDMENYLRAVHREYEEHWLGIAAAPLDSGLGSLPWLSDFTDSYADSRYGKAFGAAKDEVLTSVRSDLLGSDLSVTA